MKDILQTILIVLGASFLVIIILPFIMFWLNYFGGWIVSLIIGRPLVNALNTLFNTNYFEVNMLPMMAGALGWIGSFFRNINSIRKDK